MSSLHERFPAFGGRGPLDMRLGISLGIIATFFIVLRIYVRLRINNFGTTALVLTLVAWLSTVLTQVFAILSTLHGLGNHLSTIAELGELHKFLLFTWITVFFFNIAIPTGKVAVAAFLIEMNGQGNPKIRRSLIFVAAFNVVANIPQLILIWFQCKPSAALWDPLRQSQCDHRKNVYSTYFVGAVAAVSDFYLAIIPISMFMPLRIDQKLKWGLYFLMGCGVFAGVAAILRTSAASNIMAEDSSYKVATLFLWGEVEEWIVLITMCIPPVWPLFRPFAQRFINNATSRSRSRPQQYAPYNRTDKESHSSRAWPPRVTTTISVSSTNGATPTTIPSGKSTESMLKHIDQGGEPYDSFPNRNRQEAWVELPDYEERSTNHFHRPSLPRH